MWKVTKTSDLCESQPHKCNLTFKVNSKMVPVLPSLVPSVIFPFHLLLSPVHPTGFSFCFFPGFLAIFSLLSSNNNNQFCWIRTFGVCLQGKRAWHWIYSILKNCSREMALQRASCSPMFVWLTTCEHPEFFEWPAHGGSFLISYSTVSCTLSIRYREISTCIYAMVYSTEFWLELQFSAKPPSSFPTTTHCEHFIAQDMYSLNLYTNALLGGSVLLSVCMCVCLFVRYRNHLPEVQFQN